MKKFLAILFAVVMLLSMVACGNKQPVSDITDPTATPTTPASDVTDPTAVPTTPAPTEESEPETPEPTDEPEKENDPILGVYNKDTNTYENGFIGIGCRLDQEWDVYDTDQIAELNGMVIEMMTDESIANQLETDGYLMPFYAQANDGLITVNITVENLGLLYGSLLDEQGYAELSIEQLASALEALGMTELTIEISSTTFAGGEHTAVIINGSLQGVEFHETIVCVKIDRYIANITAASYFADVTGDILSMFYSL